MTIVANPWRIAGWSLLAGLLLLPAVAMRFTAEVDWTAGDFAAAAVLLGAFGVGVEVAARQGDRTARAGAAVAVVTAVLLLWVDLAVGIVGDAPNPMFAGVLAVAAMGAAFARLRPAGLARAMVATAAAQALAGAIALAARWGAEGPIWPWDVVGATGLFCGLWVAAAQLFRRAAR